MRVSWLKSCPRCNAGDIRENRDAHGRYLLCVQCGYYLTDSEVAGLWRRRISGGQPTPGKRLRPAASVLTRR